MSDNVPSRSQNPSQQCLSYYSQDTPTSCRMFQKRKATSESRDWTRGFDSRRLHFSSLVQPRPPELRALQAFHVRPLQDAVPDAGNIETGGAACGQRAKSGTPPAAGGAGPGPHLVTVRRGADGTVGDVTRSDSRHPARYDDERTPDGHPDEPGSQMVDKDRKSALVSLDASHVGYDRDDGTSRLSFDTKRKHQLRFAYGGGSLFAYTESPKGEFADLKHGTQFGPATIEVKLK